MQKGCKPPTGSFVTGCKRTPPHSIVCLQWGPLRQTWSLLLGHSPSSVWTLKRSHARLTLDSPKSPKGDVARVRGCSLLTQTLNAQREGLGSRGCLQLSDGTFLYSAQLQPLRRLQWEIRTSSGPQCPHDSRSAQVSPMCNGNMFIPGINTPPKSETTAALLDTNLLGSLDVWLSLGDSSCKSQSGRVFRNPVPSQLLPSNQPSNLVAKRLIPQ